MPQITPEENANIKKTAGLLAFGNLILTPLYAVDKKLGLTASILATVAMVYSLHESGKSKKSKKLSFFKSEQSPIGEAFDNVLQGADSFCHSNNPK